MCIIDGCKKRSMYNYENEIKAEYCGIHRLDNNYNVCFN